MVDNQKCKEQRTYKRANGIMKESNKKKQRIKCGN